MQNSFGIDAVRIHFNNVTEEKYDELVAPHISRRRGGQEYFYRKRYIRCRGKRNAFSVKSSLLKFADPHYNGVGLGTGDNIEPAIVTVEEKSSLDARHVPVTGIEMATMFEGTLSPEYYFRLIRPKANFEIKPYPNGRYLLSDETQVVIYNKTQELVDKRKIVFDPYAPQLIKVELRLNKKVRQKIAPWLRVLEFESLSDPNVLHSLGRIYESYITRLLGLDDFVPRGREQLTATDYLTIAAEEMRVRRAHEHEEVLYEILDMYGADQKTRNRISQLVEKERLYSCGSEVRHHIKKQCHAWKEKYPFQIDADPAIREYMDRLRDFSANRRRTKAEEQDERAAQAIIASPVL